MNEINDITIKEEITTKMTSIERFKAYNPDLICSKYVPEKFKKNIHTVVKELLGGKPTTIKTLPLSEDIDKDMLIKTYEGEFLVLDRDYGNGKLVFNCIYPAYHSEFKVMITGPFNAIIVT